MSFSLRSLLALTAVGVTALLPAIGWAQKTDFALKDGDRIVFYGDSITDQREYTSFVEDYAVTRFPKRKLFFVHSGWGGDRVTGGGGGNRETRIDRDVLAYRPTVVTIMLGMNDGGYRPFSEDIFKTYATGYQALLDQLQAGAPQARITLIQPSPFDDVTRPSNNYNDVMVRFGAYLVGIAPTRKATTADLNAPVVAMLEKANQANAELAKKIIADRVHPGGAGHLIMAEQLLKAWGATALVSRVALDAGKKSAQSENASVSDIKSDANGLLSWQAKEEALPFPLNYKDPLIDLAVRSSDFVEAMDQETLRVTGLTAPRYMLQIDADTIGTFSKEELEDGINLATQETPMLKQARIVAQLTREHNDIHFTRWRVIQVRFDKKDAPNSVRKTLDSMDAMERDFVTRQRDAAQPKPHRFTLTPAR